MALNNYALRLVAARKHWVDFQGTSLRKASLRGLSKFTWEAWIKVGAGSTQPDQRAYVETQTDSASKIRFACTPTRENNRSILRFEFQRKDGGTPTAYTYVLPQAWDDRWHHVAFSADIEHRMYALFYDGVQVQKGTLAGGGTYIDEDKNEKPYMVGGDLAEGKDKDGNMIDNENKYIPKKIMIGAYHGSNGRTYWDGKIDNVRIWDNFKSSSTFGNEMFDQSDDYATNSNLIEEWRFNEGPNWSGGTGGNDSGGGSTERGYVAGAFLSSTTNGKTATVMADIGLNLRSSPNLGDNIIRGLPRGTTVTVRSAGTSADNWVWYKVDVGDTVGRTGAQQASIADDITAASTGSDDEYTNVPEPSAPTSVGNVTRGTKRVSNTAILRKADSEADGAELWIGIDTYHNYGNLSHDFDRPYLGDGLMDTTPPTQPSNLRVITGSTTENSFTVAWNRSEDDVYVQRYELDVAVDSAFQGTITGYSSRNMGRSTEAQITGLQPGSRYYWRVRAVDSSNNASQWASSTAFRTYSGTTNTRINYSLNPSFEESVDYWSAAAESGAYPDVTRMLYTPGVGNDEFDDYPRKQPTTFGDHYLRVTNANSQSGADSGVAHFLYWKRKEVMTGSFYVRGTGSIKVVVIPMRNYVPLYDDDESTQAQILTFPGSKSTSTRFGVKSSWQRVSFTAKPNRAGMNAVQIRILSTGGNYEFDIDGMLIESGRVVRDYFDGDTNNAYWVWPTRAFQATHRGYVVESATENGFGYSNLSPSAINVTVSATTNGVMTASTIDRQEPGSPKTDDIVIEDSEITPKSFLARWNPPETNYEDIVGYELQVATTRNMSAAVTVFVPGYQLLRVGKVTYRRILGLKPKKTYYYRVRAYDELNNLSPWSTVVRVTTEAEPDQEPPKDVVLLDPLILNKNQFEARWVPTYDNVGVAGYLVDVSMNTPGNFIAQSIPAGADKTSLTVRGLTPGQRYFYSVRAYDEAGNVSSGLIIDPSTKKPRVGTYMEARTPSAEDNGGDRTATIAVESATIDPANPTSDSGNSRISDLSQDGKAMLIQMNLQGLAGGLLAANLFLTRSKTPRYGTTSSEINAELYGVSNLAGRLRNRLERPAPFVTWNKDRLLKPVTLTITALDLSDDYADRYKDLFSPGDVTWNRQPRTSSRSITFEWDREQAVIDVTELLNGGMRMYGFLITADDDILLYNSRAAANLRPSMTVQYDEQQAFALVDSEVDTSIVVSRNVFTNSTFDVVQSVMPLTNPTFQAADTRGWDKVLVTANTDATFSRTNTGADDYGGCGVLDIEAMVLPAAHLISTWNPISNSPTLTNGTGTEGDTYRVSVDGVQSALTGQATFYRKNEYVRYQDEKWVKILHDGKKAVYIKNTRRFPVTFGYSYTLSAKVRSNNTNLSPRLGIRWYWTENDDEPMAATYDEAWKPSRANEWYLRSVEAIPPAIGITEKNQLAELRDDGKWYIKAGQSNANTVVPLSKMQKIGPRYAEVELYPWPNGANTTQTGRIFFDDFQLRVDSGKQPIGVQPIGQVTLSRGSVADVTPFTKKADDVETDVVLKMKTADEKDGVRLIAPLNDEQFWLKKEEGASDATVNLIENPSFESNYGIGNRDKYYPIGNAEIQRSAAKSYFGGYSLRMKRYRSGNAQDGVRLHTAWINDSRKGALRGSFYALGTGTYRYRLLLKYRGEDDFVEPDKADSKTLTVVDEDGDQNWERCSTVIALNPNKVLQYAVLEIKGASKAETTLYIDGVQIEEVEDVTEKARAYCDGNQYLTWCFWSGAPNQSVSFRRAFVGSVRVKAETFDPALEARLRLRYANGYTTTSLPTRTPVLATWANNYAESSPLKEEPNDNFESDGLNRSPVAWRPVQVADTAVTWKVTDNEYVNRFGPNSGRSLMAAVARVETGQNTAAHIQSRSRTFAVVPGQKVVGLAYAKTDTLNLLPYLQLYFYDELNNAVGSVKQDVPMNLLADKWGTLRVVGTVPANAAYCQIALKVYAKQQTISKHVYFSSIWLGLDNQSIAETWVPLVTAPVAPLPELLGNVDLISVEMEVMSTMSQDVTAYLDGATIQFNAETPTTFNGATLSADWVGEPFNSASELYAVRFTNTTTYQGDSDNSSEIATYLKLDSWKRDDRTDEGTTIYKRRRRQAETVLPSVIRWNELSNPSFETGLSGWVSSSASSLRTRTLSSAPSGSSVAEWTIGNRDNHIRFSTTNFVPAEEGQVWTTSIQTRAINSNRLKPIGGTLAVMFFNARGERLTNVLDTAQEPFDLTVGGGWETVSATAIAPAGTASVSMEIVPLRSRGVLGMQGGDVFQFDAMMLYNGYRNRPYRDGGNADMYWEGISHGSPTIFVVEPAKRYSIRTVPFDEDGIVSASVREFKRDIKTPPKPSFYTEFRFDKADISGYATFAEIAIPYVGAKNQGITAIADVRRADDYDWVDADVEIDLINKIVLVRKGGLVPNRSYVFRVMVSAENGLLRGPSNFLYTLTTEISDALNQKKSDGTISFNGFALNGPDAKYYWVTSQDSFSLPPLRMQIEQLPRMDGAVELNSYWDRKTITLEGGVWGEDRVALDKHLKTLRATLAERKKPLRIDTLTQSNTYYTATCSGFKVTETAGENITSLQWSATFECADPFLYNAEQNKNQFTIKADGSILTAEEILSTDQRLTVNNRGTVNALPKITVDANNSKGEYAVVLYNDTTGERFFPKTTLKAGDTLVMDSRYKECRRQGGPTVDFLGSFLEVRPGANQFRLSLRSLNQQRHNLLENPSADDDFTTGNKPNIYPAYNIVNKKPDEVAGVTLSTTRDQTYAGSPLALRVDCSGTKQGQGVVFRTPKGLSAAQSWSTKKRTFTATAALRTDVTNRDWSLDKCFIRIWYTDGDRQDLVDLNGKAISAGTAPMRQAWHILTFPPIESARKDIDYMELFISSPGTQNNAYLGKPVTFYVDECKLAESGSGADNSSLKFTVNINYFERFI